MASRQRSPSSPGLRPVALLLAVLGLAALLSLHLARRPAAPVRGGCPGCHGGVDPGGPHAASAIGCVPCHLGDPAATSSATAHRGLEREPGALDTAARTCGLCHARELHRVSRSLMTTGRGIVAVDRASFGEPAGPGTLAEVLAAEAPTPAEDHLRRLCAGCHLGARRANRDDALGDAGSGCAACHLARGSGHPAIAGVPPDSACLGCHSRSARVSLSYSGLAETDRTPCAAPVRLFDGRPGCLLTPDVHHRAGLACVDCHLHTELMGDGRSPARSSAALELGCTSCHGPAPTRPWSAIDDPVSRDLLRLRGESRPEDEPVRVGARGTPVYNLRPDGAGLRLEAKAGGRSWRVPPTPADPDHALPGHARLTCAACHAAFIPSCPTCHTRFDPGGAQWDFGRGAVTSGAWVETHDGLGVSLPGLAVDHRGRIGPAAPGMNATIEAEGARRTLTLVSSFDPHTTQRAARGCASCHRSGAALGLGSGDLALEGDDGPRFTAERPTSTGRAADGWTTLLPALPTPGTSTTARGLDADEQRRILRVGVCVPCHDRADDPLWRRHPPDLAPPARCPGPRPAWLAP